MPDAFYIAGSSLPSERFGPGFGYAVGFYDALASGVPFNVFGSFTLARLSATSWRATFAEPVYDYPPVRLKECYVFSPVLTVRQVTPALNGNGHVTAVDIITAEQAPTTYTLTIYGTEVVS